MGISVPDGRSRRLSTFKRRAWAELVGEGFSALVLARIRDRHGSFERALADLERPAGQARPAPDSLSRQRAGDCHGCCRLDSDRMYSRGARDDGWLVGVHAMSSEAH